MLAVAERVLLPDNRLRNYLRHEFVTPGCVLALPGLDADNWYTGTILDYSGNSNHGIITGATQGRLSSGLRVLAYDDVDDSADCGNNASLRLTGNMSLLFWAKIPQVLTEYGSIQQANIGVDGWTFYWDRGAGGLLLDTYTGATNRGQTANGFYPFSTWALFGLVRSATATNFYVKSTSVDNFVDTGALPNPTASNANFSIGSVGGGSYPINGQIGLFRFFNGLLTAAQIDSTFRQERHLFGV